MMRSPRILSVVMGAFLIALTSSPLAAEEPTSNTTPANRIGGDYQVSKIEREEDGTFVIVFESLQKTGSFDTLTLHADHVHMGLEVGDVIRLSAEVASKNGSSAEVNQVVLFIERPEGATPIWMLSNRSKNRDLRATDYLKMHYPQSDYMIF